MKTVTLLTFGFCLTCGLIAGLKDSRPNIILMMADDVGFSDIGCYGAEIQTPNLDKLGYNGLRFRQFYNMSKCETTRSAMMSGWYLPHGTGEQAVLFPKLLQDAGYYTAMTGKQHFKDWVPEDQYAQYVFDDSFVFWAINNFFIPTNWDMDFFGFPFELNGKEIPLKDIPVKNPPFHKTDVLTDYALEFLDKSQEADKPFFLYIPYHAAHYPLQASPEDIAKYRGKYKQGWDVTRQKRFEQQKELGIIDEDVVLSPPEGNINKFRGPFRGEIYNYRPWDSLEADEQDELDLEMAVFAAMIDRMDQNIGRILNRLEELKLMENTLIIFLSDNGSCPYDSNRDFSIPPGGPDSYRTLSAAWSNVGNTPFRYYKQFGHEGGARTHFIAYWKGKIQPGFADSVAHLVDLYPTFLELTGVSLNKATPKLDGRSMLPILEGNKRSDPEYVISGFGDRFRKVRFGDMKIVRANEGPWEMYNLVKDPTELNNLAEKHPEKLAKYIQKYEELLKERQ